jgi:hypothetical protein
MTDEQNRGSAVRTSPGFARLLPLIALTGLAAGTIALLACVTTSRTARSTLQGREMEIIGGIALVAMVLVIYPYIQARRERSLAKRLEEVRDPLQAGFEVDRVTSEYRHEAGFFRKITRAMECLRFW